MEIVDRATPNDSIILLAFDMGLYRVMSPILHFQPILAFQHILCLPHQNYYFRSVEISHGMLFHLEQLHHKFLQAIDATQLQISSHQRSKLPQMFFWLKN